MLNCNSVRLVDFHLYRNSNLDPAWKKDENQAARVFKLKMQINTLGLFGFLIILNVIQVVGFDFFTGTCLILINANASTSEVREPRLLRKKPHCELHR